MRSFFAFFLCVSAATAFAAPPGQPSQLPFSIVINTEHEPFKAGAEVLLQITLTNTSNREIALSKAPGDLPQAESEYSIKVLDSQGREVPDTDYGQKIKQRKILVSRSRVSWTLGPGESLKDGAIISKLYDISHPGKYTGQVMRSIPPQLGKGTVKSNIIQVTVTE
jgi:hypothetical protein